MSFLNPSYLWALLGLVVPVAIHLWSNKEGRTIKLGSVKFLENSDVKQTNSIKLNELLLLLLRLLMITVLVFILAEPHIKRDSENIPITYLIEPSLLKNESLNTLVDSLQQNSSIRLLQTGFPDLDTYKEGNTEFPIPNYWQLANEMEVLRSDSIVVFTNGYLQGFKGKRPLLNRDIEWMVFDSEVQANEILEVVRKGDVVVVLELVSDQKKISFHEEILPLNSDALQLNQNKDSLRFLADNEQIWHPLKAKDSIAILIYYEEELETTKIYLESSFKAISKYLERPLEVLAVQDTTGIDFSSYHSLVWLSEAPRFNTSQRSLLYFPDSLANSLIEPSSSKHTFHLTKLLTTEIILAENFPEQLLKFLDLNKDLESKVQTLDKRTRDKKELSTQFTEIVSENVQPRLLSISKWLWLLLVLLIITERIFARYRKQ
ncbi:BatA domain-containing protein [Gillisia sp. JM1]|uniref:BatA domain-containing protein n=1 Tax=Gillisia sp. JM1 TaxID=1283286 RepID=UPI00040789AE|nr:BatA domain-containing protein [Gillisia sp. JM1]